MKIKAVILLFFVVMFLFGCNGPAAEKNTDSANGSLSASEQADSFSKNDLTETTLKGDNLSEVTQLTSETTSLKDKGETTAGNALSKPSTTKSIKLTTKSGTTKLASTTNPVSTTKPISTTKPTSTTRPVSTTKAVSTTKPVTTKTETTTKTPSTTKLETTTKSETTTEPQTTAKPPVTTAAVTSPQTTAAGGTVKLYIGCINAVNDGIRNRDYEYIPADGIILNTDCNLQQDDTVASLLKRVLKEKGIMLNYSSHYIVGIGGLNQYACGQASGWLYSVNGVFPQYGCDEYNLKSGDKIKILYTVKSGDVTDLFGWD